MTSIGIIILAAGQGTRMKSKRQKILHEVGGKPMVQHVVDAAQMVSTLQPVLVVGKGSAGVRELFGDSADSPHLSACFFGHVLKCLNCFR